MKQSAAIALGLFLFAAACSPSDQKSRLEAFELVEHVYTEASGRGLSSSARCHQWVFPAKVSSRAPIFERAITRQK